MTDELQRPTAESYQEYRERLAEEQAGLSKEDVMQQSGGIDLDTLPQRASDGAVHMWVKRGLKMSCEGGNHPHHSHFLIG